mmetsp:Transcript_100887/g.240448  ORF Transcript_100887/g.240448 Transcript_100887/m.240448 type:complete len:170 (+) Transcript_100887:70-579(+)|eukprot:CAMPEP_0181402446 /NCGR_PEP_ID=MMETSP1110-20121109/3179_1 /TAXON_ID=174948 /ORGANISM="Symbiodinium sp., Strain CCMP421" /LENGTH=169 /DNA_ID=CAMNT_0023524665 /DNA_START=199 /DNA_END=708 /DNA_ORIENTATION=+
MSINSARASLANRLHFASASSSLSKRLQSAGGTNGFTIFGVLRGFARTDPAAGKETSSSLFIKSSFIATGLVLLMQLAWLKVRPKQLPFFLEFGDVIGEGSGEGSPSTAKDVQDPLLSSLSPPTQRVGDDCTKGLTIRFVLDFPNFPVSHLCSANMHVPQSLPAAIEPR